MKLPVFCFFWVAVSASSIKHATFAEFLKQRFQKTLSRYIDRYVQLDDNRLRINYQEIFTLDCITEPDTQTPGDIFTKTKTRCRGSTLDPRGNSTLQFAGTARMRYKPSTTDVPSLFFLGAQGITRDTFSNETIWYRYRANAGHSFDLTTVNGQLSLFPEFGLESAFSTGHLEPSNYTLQHNMTIELDAGTLNWRDTHVSELRICESSYESNYYGENWSDSMNITAGLQATHDCERGLRADDCNLKMLVDYANNLKETTFYQDTYEYPLYTYEYATHHSGKIDLNIGHTINIRSNMEIDTPPFYLQVANLYKPAVQRELTDAVNQYLAPFDNYCRAALSSPDSLAHAAIWVDRRLVRFTDEFDCSRLFAATKIDGGGMGCLNNSTVCLTSVQEYLQGECETLNYEIVEWIGSTAIPWLRRVREYLNELTSASVGGEFYRAWASKNGF